MAMKIVEGEKGKAISGVLKWQKMSSVMVKIDLERCDGCGDCAEPAFGQHTYWRQSP